MIVGIDEAGRGPVLGPLVVGALALEGEEELERLGVKDSKLIKAARREELFDMLSGMGGHSILKIPAAGIDVARKTMTLNHLEVLAFASCLASLLKGVEVIHSDLPSGCTMTFVPAGSTIHRVFVDAADTNEVRFGDEIMNHLLKLTGPSKIEIISRHKADRDHLIVGGASILAKVVRDRGIASIERSIEVRIGSGYPGDPITREFLERWIKETGQPPVFARRSWKTCSDLLSRQRTLFDFDQDPL